MIPKTPEEITAEWLSASFEAAGRSVRARAVDVVDAHSGTTGRAALRVDWEGDGPVSVFVKLCPTDPISQQMVRETGMGRREAIFYARLASDVPVRVPQPYFADWNEDGSAYVMLLEDLAASGCSFPASGAPETLSWARSLVDGLGRLHGRYWETERFEGDLDWVERPMQSDWGRILMQMGMDQFRDEMPEHWIALVALYLEESEAWDRVLASGPQTIIHGDSHLGNLFVDDGQIGWLDWACVSQGPGMRDVAYFLTNSLGTELRRAHERELLDLYRLSLARSGGPERSEDEVWRDYRLFAAYSFVAAVTTAAAGSRMQSVEVGRRAMRRMNEATRDLDTLGALRQTLSQ